METMRGGKKEGSWFYTRVYCSCIRILELWQPTCTEDLEQRRGNARFDQ